MKRIFLVLGLAGLAAGIFMSSRPGQVEDSIVEAKARTQVPPDLLQLKPGDVFGYQFSSAASGMISFAAFLSLSDQMDGTLGNTPMGAAPDEFYQIDVTGQLWLRVLEGHGADGLATLAGSLSEVRYTANQQDLQAEPMEQPFVVRLHRDGRLEGLSFRPELPPRAPAMLENLLLSMQVVLQSPSENSWTTKSWATLERWQQAHVRARYSLIPPGSEESGWSISKVTSLTSDHPVSARGAQPQVEPKFDTPLVAHGSGNDADDLGVKFSRVDVNADYQWGTRWLKRVTLDATLEQSKGRDKVASFALAQDLTLLEGVAPPPHLASNLEVVTALVNKPWAGPAFTDRGLAMLDRLGSDPTPFAVAALYAASLETEFTTAEEMVLAYLRLYPEMSRELMHYLRSAGPVDLNREAELSLWRLLAQAGTMAAQAALLEAMDDSAWGEQPRLKAAAHISEVRSPDPFFVDSLVRAVTDDGGHDDAVWSTKVLGLGALAAGSHEIGEDVVTALIARYFESATRFEQQLLLEALGNQGHEDAVAAIADALASPDSAMRTIALQALRHVASELAVPLIDAHLVAESEPTVQTAALVVLSSYAPTEQSVAMAASIASGSSDQALVAAAVDILGAALGQFPQAGLALDALMASHPPRTIRAAILAARAGKGP